MARKGGNERSSSRGEAVEPGGYQEKAIKVNRCAKVMKGGRRFSFSALVVVGNREGTVGYGFGKARGVPSAVEKGGKEARKNLIRVPMNGTTITHEITARFESSIVRMIPAAPGTGIVAGGPVRAVLDLAGIKDVLTKNYGSSNSLNVVKAVFEGLKGLRSMAQVKALRGVSLS